MAKQLAANPKAELCCFDGKRWLRLSGRLVEDDRLEARQSMLDAYPQLQKMYRADDGNTIVYYFTEAIAVFSSFTEPPETLRL